MTDYNEGDAYEREIYEICEQRGVLLPGFTRAGAGGGIDIKLQHYGRATNLEVKLDLRADYGQRYLKWDERNGWQFCVIDEVSEMYEQLGVLSHIDPLFIPRRHSIAKEALTQEDKTFDQQSFDKRIEIPTQQLFHYYNAKDVHYIQIGNYGFYHLDNDYLGLGTPQFDGDLKLRFRAKTISSDRIYRYRFLTVLKVVSHPSPSPFDIKEESGKSFPPIIP